MDLVERTRRSVTAVDSLTRPIVDYLVTAGAGRNDAIACVAFLVQRMMTNWRSTKKRPS